MSRLSRSDWGVLAALGCAKVLIHLASNTGLFGYGYFRDEFYYLACSEHLAWGYVDHPPLSIWLLAANRLILGDSLQALRILPALAGAAVVVLTGLMARQLGGGRWAMILAALAALVAPLYWILDSFYSMNGFEILFWTLTAYLLLVLLTEERPHLWLFIGLVFGLGILNKHTMLTWGLALGVGLVLTQARRQLLSPWLWAGVGLAAVLAAPDLIWQVRNGFPSLEFYRNAELVKNVPTPPLAILINQVIVMNPLALPLWIVGLIYLLFARTAPPLRLFGIAYLVVLGLLILARSSRPDRIGGVYPILFAAGAVAFEQLCRRHLTPATGRRLAWAGAVALCVAGLALLPVSLPVLPVEPLARLAAALGATQEVEQGKRLAIPQYLADRRDWPALVDTVEEVYNRLPPQVARQTAVFTDNYGEAGAIQFLTAVPDLPVLSGHNNYYLWGVDGFNGTTIIAVGHSFAAPDVQALFTHVEQVATFHCTACVEDDTPIFVAQGLKIPVIEAWPETKHFE